MPDPVFYTSARFSILRNPASLAYYDRKRAEGERHGQAYSHAPRRVNVLWRCSAMAGPTNTSVAFAQRCAPTRHKNRSNVLIRASCQRQANFEGLSGKRWNWLV